MRLGELIRMAFFHQLSTTTRCKHEQYSNMMGEASWYAVDFEVLQVR